MFLFFVITKNMAYDNSEKRESEYNELALKIARINKLQDKINTLWQNPKGLWYNELVIQGGAEYGFILIFRCINSLYKEVHPKCTPEEKKKSRSYMLKIDNFIEESGFYDYKKHGEEVIDKFISPKAWKNLRESINNYEIIVRELLDIHGYSPDKNAVEGL